MFTSYPEALDYLYARLPMFQRVGGVAYKKDLTNTRVLCEALGNPQNRFKSIHIAGTNGKGSSAHLLASILQQAGYVTGLYTSPHLKDFRERIRLQGKKIPELFVVDKVNRLRETIERIDPSFFEVTVAMAFDYFAQSGVDMAVVEVGMGGLYDSTNIIIPEVALITNIGWDHMEFLGDTLPLIAAQKAGIIKAGCPVVISEYHPETSPVFEAQAQQLEAPIRFAAQEYTARWVPETRSTLEVKGKKAWTFPDYPLRGDYQQYNLPGVLAVTDVLLERNYVITDEAIHRGIAEVANTGLRGRWQLLSIAPRVICDTGHNLDGLTKVLTQLERERSGTLWIIFGMVRDKEPGKILQLLPADARYVFANASIPRALPAAELATLAASQGLHGEVIPDVNAALTFVKTQAAPEDTIFIGGSTFLVGELHELKSE